VRRRPILGLGATVLSLLVASCGGGRGTASTTTLSASRTTLSPTPTTLKSSTSTTSTTPMPPGISVPVVACRTTFALATPPPTVPLPTSVTVALPESMAPQMVVYVDTNDLTRLLGPRGWTCVAAYSADGSGGIDLFAPGETPPPSFSQVPPSDEAITIVESGGSSTQAAGLACPYFPAAAAITQSAFGHGCSAPPKAEKVGDVGSGVVAFQDPPGTKGGGVPSGGPFLAYSVMSYSVASQPGTYLGTCTDGQRVCAFMLNYFASLYGKTKSGVPTPLP
jgi:hypothetical protein